MLLYNEHGFRVSGISLPVGIMRISTAFPFLNEHSTAQRASERAGGMSGHSGMPFPTPFKNTS
jgi:hypothetical protein